MGLAFSVVWGFACVSVIVVCSQPSLPIVIASFAILAVVTLASVILAVVTPLSAILTVLTAPSFSLDVPTAVSAILSVVTRQQGIPKLSTNILSRSHCYNNLDISSWTYLGMRNEINNKGIENG